MRYDRRMKARYPIPARPTKPTLSTVLIDPSTVFQKVYEALQEIETLKNEHLAQVDGKMQEIDTELRRLKKLTVTLRGEKGDMPIPGVHFPIPRNGVNGQDGKDGLTPVIDHELIARTAAQLIPRPTDGKNADPADVLILFIRALEKGTVKLKLDHIEGLDDKFGEIRRAAAVGQMRGGGDTVAAGVGVTITQSNGVKTISSSGGGFSTLAATETPDGNTTVFTFSTATAQPTFILSDNVMQRAVSKAGTVNWTWNAALKQATMTIAPQDDILAIV